MTAEWLLSRVRAIVDPVLRRRALAAMLAGADPEEAASAAADLLARGTGGDVDVAAGIASLVQAMADLPYPARQAMYLAAQARGADALARLLFDASPATANGDLVARQMRPERPLRARGRPLTLGERKSLARSSRRDLIASLVRDPHPDVVRILLDNPRLTEHDVVVLAASRPAVPASLALVAEHPRWSARRTVRRALVFNPHTPVHIAIRLATTLSTADWREITGDNHLPDALRDHARDLTRGPATDLT